MAARSAGIFPIEGFHPDKLMEVPVTTPAACPTPLKNITTIRVVLVNAAITGNADVTVTIGGQVVVFTANDLDINGVGISHVRGSLCDADNNMVYVTNIGTGSVSVDKVYLDAVDF